VEKALSLIKTYDRRRYDRLLRDLERVCIRAIPIGIGNYSASINGCELDTRFFLAETTSPEVIASTIVHEASHARLRRCGIGYEQDLRARVEAVCFRREIVFAAKLPNGQEVRELAERSLDFYSADEYWTDAASRERYVQGAEEVLRHLGVRPWLARIALSLLRRRMRKSAR
jgi:hypothetical protein